MLHESREINLLTLRAIKYFVERFCEEKAIITKKYWFSFSLTLILEII